MQKFLDLVIRFPKTVILVLILITVFFGYQLQYTRMETDAEAMMPQDHPAIKYNDKVEEIFEVKDTILIGIINEGNDGIFNAETLARIKRLTEKIAELKGVIANKEDDVLSLSTLKNIQGTEFGFDVSYFMEELPANKAEIAALKESIYSNDMYVGSMVSQDGTGTMILAELEEGLANRFTVYYQIKELIAAESGGADRLFIAGRPVLEVTFGIFMGEDMQKMMPMVILAIIVTFALIFGTLRGVILPLLVVIGSVIWALGIMALLRIPMFTISTMMPIIIMAVGIADSIHILSKYYHEARNNPNAEKRDIVMATMTEMWSPVVMTSLTTALGFISLVTAYMAPIRYFGIFIAVGVMAAMVLSLAFLPAALMLLKIQINPWARYRDGKDSDEESGLFAKVGAFLFTYNTLITWITVAVMVFWIAGIFFLSTNASWIENIKHSSEVYIANTELNKKFDGTLNLYVVVEGKENGIMKSPQILAAIDGLQQDIEQLEVVGGSRSIAEYVKRMNRVMNEDKKEFEVIPDSRELIAQYLLMYSMSGDPGDFDDVVDYDYRMANIWVQMKSDYTGDTATVINRIKDYTDKHFDNTKVETHLAGRAYTSFVWVDLLISGQINSIIFSIITVFIVTALMFRSLVAGIFNIIPICSAMLFNFGLMGHLGFPMDVTTALASGIIIGVGIDYTIHFIAKYHLETAKGKDAPEATLATMITTGKAIFFNAIAVIAGFMVLFSSNFPANRHMGGMIAFSMFTSFFAAMTILPALINKIRPKFIFEENNHAAAE